MSAALMGFYIKCPPFDKNPQFIEMPEISALFENPAKKMRDEGGFYFQSANI